jgi:hypothetical protein
MARKRECPLKMHERPMLAWRARWLLEVDTDTLLLYLSMQPSTPSTRTFRALVLAEALYRVGIREPDTNKRVWEDIFGPKVPMPPGFGAASEAYPRERAWVELDAQLR